MSLRPLLRKVSAVNAVIAIGTFCMFSLRFSAVTTISSSASAYTADPISAAMTAAAAERTAKGRRRACDGSSFPSIGLVDIQIPPMIFFAVPVRPIVHKDAPHWVASRPYLLRLYTTGESSIQLRANSCLSHRVMPPNFRPFRGPGEKDQDAGR